jgi:hypothetical protein
METDGKSLATRRSPDSELHELIRVRAEEIYVRNGRVAGHDLENWADAEREILEEQQAHSRRNAIVIKVNGVKYVGAYSREGSDGYAPGEFAAGVPVPVRFEGDKMFVKRPNGQELETTIVRKIG